MTNADRKAAIRERMASTGDNYTTAKRAIEQARAQLHRALALSNGSGPLAALARAMLESMNEERR